MKPTLLYFMDPPVSEPFVHEKELSKDFVIFKPISEYAALNMISRGRVDCVITNSKYVYERTRKSYPSLFCILTENDGKFNSVRILSKKKGIEVARAKNRLYRGKRNKLKKIEDFDITQLIRRAAKPARFYGKKKRYPTTPQTLNLFFDTDDFSKVEIANMISYLSSVYELIGGDELEIVGTGDYEFTEINEPDFVF